MTVETVSNVSVLEGEDFDALIQTVDLVCVTDWDRAGLVSISSLSCSHFDLALCLDSDERRLSTF